MAAILSERHADPRLIPLPPSPPPIKPFLPTRRPVGWVSILPERICSSTSDSIAQRHASPGGRKISDTLLRAVAPSDTPAAHCAGSKSATVRALTAQELLDADETEYDTSVRIIDHLDELEEEGPDDSLLLDRADLSAQVAALTDQERDEIWMSYVRSQLAALFPDLSSSEPIVDLIPEPLYAHEHAYDPGNELDFDGNHLGPFHGHQGIRAGQERSVSGSTVESVPVATPRSVSGTSMISAGDPEVRMGLGQRAGRELVSLTTVPSMRGEIEGLREEIERLRGVVGGLAEGLGAQTAQTMQTVADDVIRRTSESRQDERRDVQRETVNFDEESMPALSSELLRQALSIVRLLDTLPQEGQPGFNGPRKDELIFEKSNLDRVELIVRQMVRNDDTASRVPGV